MPDWRRQLGAGVRRIGAEALERFRSGAFETRLKGAIDPVTDADLWCEQQLIELIQNLFGDDHIVAEESFDGQMPADCWIIDPIDGTVNFATGHPMFALNLCRMRDGQPEYALTFAPAMGEFFWAEQGQGAWFGGRPMQIDDSLQQLDHAVGATGFPYWLHHTDDQHNNIDAFNDLLRRSRALRRGGCASLDLAYTADGRFSFYWEPGLKPWDIAAGALMVREAGGVVSGYDGAPLRDWFSPILACAPQLHKPLVEILTQYDVHEHGMDLQQRTQQ